jgi:hypothetical protein
MKTVCLFLVLMWPAFIAGAQTGPHIAYVYPAGGQVGTTFQITVGGQNVMSVSNAFFTGAGIRATILDRNRPMSQKDFAALRDRLKVLREKFQASGTGAAGTNAWTEADAVEEENIRQRILKNPPNRKANPAMIETITMAVSIATNASPGETEIRLVTLNGLSNPFKFCIGAMPEVSKPAAAPANPDLDSFLVKLGRAAMPSGTPKYESRIAWPVTVNGQIMPGEVDRYRFAARRGQQLVVIARARSLIPYLADAVPGWFEATLTIYDAQGKELANEERFDFKPDPVMYFEVPDDGDYVVEIHDSIFRGREDFVYRLTLGELPFVTGIFPLGCRAGEKTDVTLMGWNLRETSLAFDSARLEPGITALTGQFFDPVPFAVDDLRETVEQPGHPSGTAQIIWLPTIINGRIGQPGEEDVFKFDGYAGRKVVVEVFARRLNSPLDSYLRLADAAGKSLAFNDDFEDKGSGLETHHADSYLMATLPAEGTYSVRIGDAQGRGGPAFAYRLRISEPRPDFALRLVPSSLAVRAGMNVPVTVYALRKDGFTNAIDLHLENAPGFSLGGPQVPENRDKVQVTLKASQGSGKIFNPVLRGSATIGGQTVTRTAVPADDLMQAFAYRHLVPAREWEVAVTGIPRPAVRDGIKILSDLPIKIPTGGSGHVRIATPAAFAGRYNVELKDAPDGISLVTNAPMANGIELIIAADADKVGTGTNGNLILDLLPKNLPAVANPKKAKASPSAVATLPAIPFQVVAE